MNQNLLQLLDSWYVDPQKGGKGQGRKPSEFDLKQVLIGITVELEHTTDHNESLSIVLDHLSEDREYYTKLKQIHQEGNQPLNVDQFGLPV